MDPLTLILIANADAAMSLVDSLSESSEPATTGEPIPSGGGSSQGNPEGFKNLVTETVVPLVSLFGKAAQKAQKTSEIEKRIAEEQDKALVLIDMGDLDGAEKTLNGIKTELVKNLSEGEKEILKASPRYDLVKARSRLLRAQIADRRGDHQRSEELHRDALERLNGVLGQNASNEEALLLRGQAHHRLQDYGAALKDLRAASKEAADDYREKLKSLFERIGSEKHMAQAQEEIVREMACLTEQLKIAEALRDDVHSGPAPFNPDLGQDRKDQNEEWQLWNDTAEDLALQIRSKSDPALLEKMTLDAEEMAEKGFLASDALKVLETDAYADASTPEKIAVLQNLHRLGLIGSNKAALAKEGDPTKKLVYEYKIALLENRLVEGELAARNFKAEVEARLENDPKLLERDAELGVAYEEARQTLRELTLQHLDEMIAQTEMIGPQRHQHLGGHLGYFSPKEHIEFLRVLKSYVRREKADTLEEATAAMRADYPKRFEKFWRTTVIGKGEQATFHMPETTAAEREKAAQIFDEISTKLFHAEADESLFDPQAYPELFFAKLDGGKLDLARAYNTELDTKPIRVVVGREGGFIQFPGAMGGSVYFFPPSDKEKVVFIQRNEIIAPRLNEGEYYSDPQNLSSQKWDYAAVFPVKNPFITPPMFVGSSINFEKKGLRFLETAVPHLNRLEEGHKDPLLTTLFNRYTREGLEKEATPEGRREALLGYAKALSDKDGSFPLAEIYLKEIFATEYDAALEAVNKEGGVKEASKEVEGDREEIKKRVREGFEAQVKRFEAMKSRRLSGEEERALEAFNQKYPDGVIPEEVIKAAVQAAVDEEIKVKVDLKVYAKMDAMAEAGKFGDSVGLEAWNVLKSQKDPTNEWLRISDENWADAANFIENEAVMFAMTAPLTMGAGSLVRGALGGTALVCRLVAQGGWRAFAARSVVFLAGATAEGLVMTGVGGAFGSEFAAKGVGYNVMMSVMFHGAGKGWAKAAARLGIDDEAVRLAQAAGKSTAGKQIGNFAGTMLTQTKAGVAWSYVHEVLSGHDDPRGYWERVGQEGFRMGFNHVGNKMVNAAFDHAPMKFEMLAENRQRMASAAFKSLYTHHLTELNARGVRGKQADAMARNVASREAAAYAQGLRLNQKRGGGEPAFVFDDAAAKNAVNAAKNKAPKLPAEAPAPQQDPDAAVLAREAARPRPTGERYVENLPLTPEAELPISKMLAEVDDFVNTAVPEQWDGEAHEARLDLKILAENLRNLKALGQELRALAASTIDFSDPQYIAKEHRYREGVACAFKGMRGLKSSPHYHHDLGFGHTARLKAEGEEKSAPVAPESHTVPVRRSGRDGKTADVEPFPQQEQAKLAVASIDLQYNTLDGLRRRNGLGESVSPVAVLESRVSESGEAVEFVVKTPQESETLLDHIQANVDTLTYGALPLKVRSRTENELILDTPSGRPISVKATAQEVPSSSPSSAAGHLLKAASVLFLSACDGNDSSALPLLALGTGLVVAFGAGLAAKYLKGRSETSWTEPAPQTVRETAATAGTERKSTEPNEPVVAVDDTGIEYPLKPYDIQYEGGRVGNVNDAWIDPKNPNQLMLDISSYDLSNPFQFTGVRMSIPRRVAPQLGIKLNHQGNLDRSAGMPMVRIEGEAPQTIAARAAVPMRQASEPAQDWRDVQENWGGMAARSNQGLHYKDRNEDRHLMAAFADGRSVLAVIDGMGGHSGGDRAADVAREAMKNGIAAGNFSEDLLLIADQAVVADNQAQGLRGKEGEPGAVAMVVEIAPRPDGRYNARFSGIGDCEAVVIRPGAAKPVVHHTMRPNRLSQAMRQFKLLDDGRLDRGQTIDFRTDPHANVVDGALGYGDTVETSVPQQPLRDGDIVILGSDGLFENFGSLNLIHQIIRNSGAKTAGEIRDVVMTEALIRMSLCENAFNKILSHKDYVAAYREATGQEPPAGWRGFYEPYRDASGQARGFRMDKKGNIYEVVHDPASGMAKDVTGQKIDHFKNDNVTVAVQVVGDPVH